MRRLFTAIPPLERRALLFFLACALVGIVPSEPIAVVGDFSERVREWFAVGWTTYLSRFAMAGLALVLVRLLAGGSEVGDRADEPRVLDSTPR